MAIKQLILKEIGEMSESESLLKDIWEMIQLKKQLAKQESSLSLKSRKFFCNCLWKNVEKS